MTFAAMTFDDRASKAWFVALLIVCTVTLFGVTVVVIGIGAHDLGLKFSASKSAAALKSSPVGPEGKRVACVFRGSDAAPGSYPEDGLCDFAIYDNVRYAAGKIHSEEALTVFCRRSRHAARTLYLAALSPDSLDRLAALNSSDFAKAMKALRRVSDLRGLGIFRAFASGSSFGERLEDFKNLMSILRQHVSTHPGAFFVGGQFFGLDLPSNQQRYLEGVQRLTPFIDIFIAITHVSATRDWPCVPEPTAAWYADSFNNHTAPTLSAAVELLSHASRNATKTVLMLSLTMAVVTYRGSNSLLHPPTLGARCEHSVNGPYHEGCKRNSALLNRYSQYDAVVFDVDAASRETRCYETPTSITHKITAARKEMNGRPLGWALFNAEQEDGQGSGCTLRAPEPYNRIRLVRSLA